MWTMGVIAVGNDAYRLKSLFVMVLALLVMMPGTALATRMIFQWGETPGRYPWSPPIYESGSVSRSASVDYSGYCPGCGIDGSDEYYNVGARELSSRILGTWSGNAVSNGVRAEHESTVSEERVDFRGAADSGYGDNQAESTLKITFQVDEAGSWWLDGDHTAGSIWVQLSQDGEQIHDAYGTRPWLSEERRPGDPYTFFLVPDIDYELSFRILTYFGSEAEGSISWSVVPEPGTAAFLGLGLGMLGARRRSFVH